MPDLPAAQRAIRERCEHPSGSFVPFPRDAIERSIPERFEEQVQLHGERRAVKTLERSLTYVELNRAANRLARAILEGCPGEQEQVGILLEHGASQIVAILAVLKAGKAYVPLDPSYPEQRLKYMFEDSETALLVTNKTNVPFANALGPEQPVIDIGAVDSALPSDNLDLHPAPRSHAVILYTSGSTGRPKGYSQLHRNVLHDIFNYTNAGHFCEQDRFLLVSSLCFADSLRTIYGALLNGASLCPFDIKAQGIAPLADWIIEQKLTIYRSVPTVFRHFVETLDGGESFSDLRLIYLSGEPVYDHDVKRYQQHFPDGCVLVNRLGTGEALTYRWYFIDKETSVDGVNVPVGYPVDGKELVLLDESPPEANGARIGEIGIKSEYLSPGYWKKPELTRANFLPDPDGGNERIYRSGDVGCLLPDGCLVHLGRTDFQVKIRGHRIEIAEIEANLRDHPGIAEAVVSARTDGGTDKRLVAYLTLVGPDVPTVTSLRSALQRSLPDYMVPSTFMILEALPVTPNGKVDRGSLPDPSYARPDLDRLYAAPRNPVEETLSGIWAEVLELEQVGIHDPFLELGGDSLLANRIIVRVIGAFDKEVPLRQFFESPTVAAMAAVILGSDDREGL